MMKPLLTVVVPNYNRGSSLRRLLRTVFKAIEYADCEDIVRVLVVDDYSTQDIKPYVSEFTDKRNFLFRPQRKKCGNAEVAFLSTLELIGTRYTWLLGNDDYVSEDSLSIILPLLAKEDIGFLLLNPKINRETHNQFLAPFTATAPIVAYDTTHDLFMDFGFVTSTTTFPCLIFKTAPVRDFHAEHNLCQYANVYSHSFTLYGALKDLPACFLSEQVVAFNHNETADEYAKLVKQAPGAIPFFHQSIGLCRLIDSCAKATGVATATLMGALEDQVNKEELIVHETTLGAFVFSFFLKQLLAEEKNYFEKNFNFGYLSKSEAQFITDLIEDAGTPEMANLARDILGVHMSLTINHHWKYAYYTKADSAVRDLGETAYAETTAKHRGRRVMKVFSINTGAFPMAGKAARIDGQLIEEAVDDGRNKPVPVVKII